MAKSVKKSKSPSKTVLSQLRDSESSASIIFGAIVVIVVGILLFNYSRSTRQAAVPDEAGMTENTQVSETGISLPTIYVTEMGDSLWKIAEKFYGSGYNWVDVAAANQLSEADGIRVGMTLAIPTAKTKEMTMQTNQVVMAAAEPTMIEAGSYQVQAGDSLWKIAVRAYGDGYKWTSIYTANKNLIANPNTLFVGWTLSLPR